MKLITALVFPLALSCVQVMAQNVKTKIYFLADTIDVPKNQRILEIHPGLLDMVRTYEFFVKLYPDDLNLMYTWVEPKNTVKAPIVDQLPNHHYRSWKSLFELLTNKDKPFESYYQLYITEKLPGNRYVTHKVYREQHRTTSHPVYIPPKKN